MGVASKHATGDGSGLRLGCSAKVWVIAALVNTPL
jgi:hypothetical protein